MEEYVGFLLKGKEMDEAAFQLAKILDDGSFVSQQRASKYQLWMQLCEIISSHSQQITKLNVEKVIRAGIEKYERDVGKLWVSLANYYIGLAHIDKARDVFEEGMNKVATVRDFSLIWEAYSEFEEKVLHSLIGGEEEEEEEGEEEELEFELQSARYEELINRRPLLINSVKLRQNPHNVSEWHKRVKYFSETSQPTQVIETYSTAIKTVDPFKTSEKVCSVWINYARFYEDNQQVESARKIFSAGTKGKFKKLDDLASVWCQWAEMELRNGEEKRALEVLREATEVPPRWRQLPRGAPLSQKLYRSTKLWCFLADVTESLCGLEETKEVYEKMIEVGVVTPQIILNYAQLLEEKNYFEESFKVYQKGVETFTFPYSMDLWISYLSKFVKRYEGTQMERGRELFEQAIEQVPPSDAKILFIMYADFEEKYGLARHAMYVYDKATKAVQVEDKYMMYLLYIARATEFFGVTRTRAIFEQAISSLPDQFVKDICLKYASLEKKLGEIDRARAIYIHASQYCDPSVDVSFWETFHNFEVSHGNEDTFRNMLRVKRSVQAQYNSQLKISSLESAKQKAKEKMNEIYSKKQEEPMRQLEEKRQLYQLQQVSNPEEIKLDSEDSESDDEDEVKKVNIQQKAIPKAVYGGLKVEEQEFGAKERLNKRKK